MMMSKIIILFTFFISGCAVLHHVQISEIDSSIVLGGERFEIKVSEIGVSFKEATGVAKALTQSESTRKDLGKLQEYLSYFQMGPRTGQHVFNDDYADKVFSVLKGKCPSLNYSGLTLVRETRKYPVVSGEIVKIIGFCKS